MHHSFVCVLAFGANSFVIVFCSMMLFADTHKANSCGQHSIKHVTKRGSGTWTYGNGIFLKGEVWIKMRCASPSFGNVQMLTDVGALAVVPEVIVKGLTLYYSTQWRSGTLLSGDRTRRRATTVTNLATLLQAVLLSSASIATRSVTKRRPVST